MRTIRVSEEVWQAIANRGKFGETEDDVLRRVFELPTNTTTIPGRTLSSDRVKSYRNSSGHRIRFADKIMTTYIGGNKLHVEFHGGPASDWTLPDRSEKAGIGAVLHNAILFAKSNGATLGQINYIRKTLTSNGYHLTK